MTATRIDFQSADAPQFNLLRDQWRSAAVSCALTTSGLRLAGVLPTFVNRQYGYAFPSDEELASEIGKSRETVKRGLNSLHEFHLIERVTRPFRNEKGIVVGKQRRIYLTLPEPKGHIDQPKGHFPAEPKGQFPKGHSEPKGQNRTTEGTPGVANTLDSTPDYFSAYEREELIEGTYTRTDPSVAVDPSVVEASKEKKAQPHSDPSVKSAAPASSPAHKPNSYLSAKNGDDVAFEPSKKNVPSVPTSDENRSMSSSSENDPSVETAPSPVPSVRWQDAKHPKILEGRPLSRRPFPPPQSVAAAREFLRRCHVPETEWPNLMPNLMAGHLYEYDIEPWMDAA